MPGAHGSSPILPRGVSRAAGPAGDRLGYAGELRRVLRPGGKFLLRASLHTAGVRNDMDEVVIGCTFAGWQIERMEQTAVPSDTRMLDVLLVRLTPGP